MSDPFGTQAKCSRCSDKAESLMCTGDQLSLIGSCRHIICTKCFKAENINTPGNYKCPYCKQPFFQFIKSIEEAILIGRAASLSLSGGIFQLKYGKSKSEMFVNKAYKDAIELFEQALLINPTNIVIIKCILHLSVNRLEHYNDIASKPIDRMSITARNASTENATEVYRYKQRAYECCVDLIDSAFDSTGRSLLVGLHNEDLSPRTDKIEDYYDILATLFYQSSNYSMAFSYAKKAYELSLRSSNTAMQTRMKNLCKVTKDVLAKEPPLRFAVGDEVEFLHELEIGSEWKRGKVVELYYHECSFDKSFTAPYIIQLIDPDASTAAPVYVWAKADLDRYVRKVGVRSIEDTRHQARLDAKVAELAYVYCSAEFIENVYSTLAQDEEFCSFLAEVWHMDLSPGMLCLYRTLVMYLQPLVPTDSGYHVPTSEEVIAEIRAYFDPSDAALASYYVISNEQLTDSKRIKALIINMLRYACADFVNGMYIFKIDTMEGMYLRFYVGYPMLFYPESLVESVVLSSPKYRTLITNYFSLALPMECRTPALTTALSKALSSYALMNILPDPQFSSVQRYFITSWKIVLTFLELGRSGPTCECLFVYFFVKTCLDQGAGVPKPALAVYERMNMQLSKEFIRCANPTCEHNRLDQSEAEVKFKKCSRCQTVIYCSRGCQVAHYPVHKALCIQHAKV